MAFEDNQRFYEGAIKEYGISALGVHWSSKENQYKRFEIITTLINEKLQSHSFADIGCGFGEYYQYLLQNNIYFKTYCIRKPNPKYRGYKYRYTLFI